MNILCFIDNLGSGGAQRQLVNLALALKEKGHIVSFLTYYKSEFYLSILQENNIAVTTIESPSYLKRVIECRKHIRSGKFDAVISFLETPSFIAEVASFPFRKWKLVVGERSAAPKILKTLKGRLYRLMHVFSDYVVSNSNTNRRMVKKANPFLLNRKNKTIYNIYNFDVLDPAKFEQEKPEEGKFHIVVAASHQRLKNLKNLAIAISLLDEDLKNRLAVDWYGRQVEECYKENLEIVRQLKLEDTIKFYPPTLDIYQKMVNADAVGLFSIYEGLSNTVCEAMCLGKPVITTEVSDNKEILDCKGLISEATSPESLKRSLEYLLSLSSEELEEIGAKNKEKAHLLFSKETIVNSYISLLSK